ncbi:TRANSMEMBRANE PROTEIN HTP-1 RELATED [Salix koriyanagi]|uniref:GDT1 family protein n=2 Tax=Salix TaxID=40685 RepID=A0A9Q0VZK1_9ROSI|nr:TRANSMEMBRANE PROTEIN HTP-1 RELATED [Salix koriyanagi]
MEFRSNLRFLYVAASAAFLLLFSFSYIAAAQADGAENEGDGSRSFQDLGRRGMIVTNGVDAKSVIELDSGLGIFDAFFASFSMIMVSEIGDETFIIAALMAMRHPKSIVLSGALTALIVMTVLSTGLGRIVPNLISRKHTNSAATGTYYINYIYFGSQIPVGISSFYSSSSLGMPSMLYLMTICNFCNLLAVLSFFSPWL